MPLPILKPFEESMPEERASDRLLSLSPLQGNYLKRYTIAFLAMACALALRAVFQPDPGRLDALREHFGCDGVRGVVLRALAGDCSDCGGDSGGERIIRSSVPPAGADHAKSDHWRDPVPGFLRSNHRAGGERPKGRLAAGTRA